MKIKPGQLIRFHAKFDKAIHAECNEVQRAVVTAAREAHTVRMELRELPSGLKPKTLNSYVEEWRQYVRFAERVWTAEVVPGKDGPWNAFLLWKYMLHRAEKCKPTTVFSAVSALAHVGAMKGFVLPTQKWDGNPLFYRQLKNMKRDISMRHRGKNESGGATFDVRRSTPIGSQSISLLLSYFQIYNEAAFLDLPRLHRHHLFISMMQHTCGMRFGHFLSRSYRVSSFVKDRYGTFRLVTDWHRYSGRRSYCLEFARTPRWPCLHYHVYDASGVHKASIVTAQVMQWHFDQLERVGESLVFAPVFARALSRVRRKEWLQSSLLAALHPHEAAVRRRVALVSPHAFRAGLAGDLLRAGVAPQTIAIWCRWWSMRAMRIYADRQELCFSRSAVGCRLFDREQ